MYFWNKIKQGESCLTLWIRLMFNLATLRLRLPINVGKQNCGSRHVCPDFLKFLSIFSKFFRKSGPSSGTSLKILYGNWCNIIWFQTFFKVHCVSKLLLFSRKLNLENFWRSNFYRFIIGKFEVITFTLFCNLFMNI
jgi:hypothetical protein